MMKQVLAVGTLIAFTAVAPSSAFAVGSGGLENASFSAQSLAMGDAVTATPNEPAAISYNPAGIADLPGVQFQGNSSFISMFTWKKNNEAEGNTRSSGTISMVPTGYLTINPGKIFCDRLAFGIGMDSPFGLMNKYKGGDASVHYTGWRNYLKMYSLKPAIAYKITDKWSIGGGPMWYRVYDFGGIQGYPNSLVGTPLPDGQLRLNTSGNHWGWQMGTLLKLTPKHRLGYYFRSPVNVKTSGLVKVEGASVGGPSNFETGAHTKIPLPMNMTWAYAYQPTEKTHYEVDFTWTRWSSLKRLRIVADPTPSVYDNAILDAVGNSSSSDKDWTSGFGIELGASHKLTEKLTLRGGSFFFWTPVPKDHFTPSIPDSNHLAICLGAGYKLSKYLTADIAYYNSFYFRRRIDNAIGESSSLSNSSVDGIYYSYLQSLTVSLTFHWDDLFPRVCATQPEGSPIDIKTAP